MASMSQSGPTARQAFLPARRSLPSATAPDAGGSATALNLEVRPRRWGDAPPLRDHAQGRPRRFPRDLTRSTLVLAAFVLVLSTPAFGQGGWTGAWWGGLWGNLGVGHGSAGTSCDNCGTVPTFNVTNIMARIGGTPNAYLRTGLGLDGWSDSPSGYSQTMVDFSLLVYYYPLNIHHGLFVGGGVGYSHYSAAANTAVPSTTGEGLGLTAQAGLDIRVARTIALTPNVLYGWGDVGNINISAGGGNWQTGWKQHYFAVGLAISYLSPRGSAKH